MSKPFGGLPMHLDPESGCSPRRALVLPGAAYSPSHPLLDFGRVALLQHGWSVRQVWWDVHAAPSGVDPTAWVGDRIAEAVRDENDLAPTPETWLVMAKSLGTRSVLAEHTASAYVLFTPLLTAPDVVAGIERRVADEIPVLLVGGTGDELWSSAAARSLGCDVLEIPGADHGMYVPGDAVRTAEAHLEVARAVDAFLVGLTAP